jgi:ectoine hydroxylase-related dioxygenase (phytanoyl-CoA dioxygenase family)
MRCQHQGASGYARDLIEKLENDGYVIAPTCLPEETLDVLSSYLTESSYAQRNLLALPIVRELAASGPVRALAEAVLGRDCVAVKGTFFNKTEESNWKVPWHQDLTIMVRERKEVAGFGPWTIKEGIVHVQPNAEVLGRILAIRLHLDASNADNGPLRVVPGSHRLGRLSPEQILSYPKEEGVVCTVPRGGALLMRPLLLHASSACTTLKPRRVVHLEYAASELLGGLEWFDRVYR